MKTYTDGTPHEWIMDAKQKSEFLELTKEELSEEILRLREEIKHRYMNWSELHQAGLRLSSIHDDVITVAKGFHALKKLLEIEIPKDE